MIATLAAEEVLYRPATLRDVAAMAEHGLSEGT